MKAYWFSQHGHAMFGHNGAYEVRPEPYKEDAVTISLCQRGLHASIDPFDAWQHRYDASTLDLVELSGTILSHGSLPKPDKHVASERTHLARIEAWRPLINFNRWCALQVAHLWDCPPFVKEFLEGSDSSYNRIRNGDVLDCTRTYQMKTLSLVQHSASMAASLAACVPTSPAVGENALKAIRFFTSPISQEARNAEQAQRDKFLELVTEAFAKVGVTV